MQSVSNLVWEARAVLSISSIRLCYPTQPYYNLFQYHRFCPSYIVKSTKGDLLHVLRFCELKKEDGSSSSGEYIATHFMVFKVSFKREECEWDETVEYVELKSLGDEALRWGQLLCIRFGFQVWWVSIKLDILHR
ncbi:hypothetical protein ACE6H2_007712 [Prunus campanulata]